ncbi:class I SAM-dependent methyltransferase [Kiloniella majae]|uniref:class I SAM-dependent methyltransferase n=1 Tax=Kiloniella majae TaxID=1938558 RepID=UPI001302663C|nr:class I SAM-dependent methyltransferase [Kiloniella majae]
MVKEAQEHEAQLAEARSINPAWYEEEQKAEAESPWRHHLKKRRSFVKDSIARYLSSCGKQKAETMLDLGCGDGNNLAWLTDYAEQLWGSDYNILRLARVKERKLNVGIFLGNILDYPVVDNTFEIVYFNHVLEHIQDDDAALATAHRVLKPGGLLVLGVPNEGVWWWQLAYKRAPGTLESTDHVHFYTAETISQKVLTAGFSITEVKHLGWGPPDWTWDMRVRKYKILDDLFDIIGKLFIPTQASSLYIMAIKENN